MPDLVRLPGGDEPRCWIHDIWEISRRSILTQHSTDCRGAEVQTRTSENLSDSDSSHGRAEDPQPPHEVADEVREPVHWLGETDESVGTVFVEARHPGGDGEGSHEECTCGLGEGPGSRLGSC